MANKTYKTTLSFIFNQGFTLFKENAKDLFTLAAIFFLPGLIIMEMTNPILNFIGLIYYIFGSFVYVIGSIHIISAKYDKKKFTFKQAKNKGLEQWGKTFMYALGLGIMLILLYILLIIPGLIFNIFWTFAIYFIILSNKKLFEAMKASKQLVQGQWWRTFGYLLAISLVFIGSVVILELIVGALFDKMITDLIIAIATILLSVIITPINTVLFREFAKEKSIKL